MRKHKAFTFVESLVIVMILTAVMALIVSWLSGARESAKRAKCLHNLHQLWTAFTTYATEFNGRTPVATIQGGQIWTKTLSPYLSSPTIAGSDSAKKQLQAYICPSAVDYSNDPGNLGFGTANRSWGNINRTFTDPLSDKEPLVIGDEVASYGYNSALGWNYPTAGSPNRAIGLIANAIDMDDTTSGKRTIYGDAWVKGIAIIRNNARITGTLTVGGNHGGDDKAGKVVEADPSTIKIPDVSAIHAALAARPNTKTMSSIPANTTLDFDTNPVIYVTGSANLNNITKVIGSGTLLLYNNSSLPNKSWPFNIVSLGGVGLQNGNLNGSVYMHGNASGNGTGKVYGNLVTEGKYDGNAGPSFYATNPPDWDTESPRITFGQQLFGQNNFAPRVPLFADAIWPESSPAIGSFIATDTSAGDVSSTIGRYYINRHNKAIDVIFLDGHGETVNLKNLQKLKWSPQFPD